MAEELDNILSEDTLVHIKESVNDSIVAWIKSGCLTNTVKRGLEKVVANQLGITYDNFGRATIDECQITGVIKDKVQERASKYFESIFEKFMVRVLDNELLDSIVESMFIDFERSARSAAYDAQREVGRKFEADITKRVKQVLEDKLSDALVPNTDPTDPESFGGKLGEMVMASLARKLIASYPVKS